MIFVECNPDTAIVRALVALPQREIVHELKGKFGIAKMMGQRKGLVGLVDEDPGSVQPRYFMTMKVKQDLTGGIRLLSDEIRNNRLLVVCPYLEAWIAQASKDARLDLSDYSLPRDPASLHKVVNIDLRRFERVVEDLKGSQRIETLRDLLKQVGVPVKPRARSH